MNKDIFVLQGNKAAGKDTVAFYINYILGTPSWMHRYWIGKIFKWIPIWSRYKITRYAESLKEVLAVMLKVPKWKLEDRHFKEHCFINFNKFKIYDDTLEKVSKTLNDKSFNRHLKAGDLDVANTHNLSVRQMLQFWGTNVCRKYLGDKLWINLTLGVNPHNLIIADQRFIIENEVTSKLENAVIIHIIRPNLEVGQHASEKELSTLLEEKKYDYLIDNNGDLKDLFYKTKDIIYNLIY